MERWRRDGMERKQFQLTRHQAAAVRREAARRKLSCHVRDEDRMGRAIGVVGKFASGQKDLSRDDDRELADAFRK